LQPPEACDAIEGVADPEGAVPIVVGIW